MPLKSHVLQMAEATTRQFKLHKVYTNMYRLHYQKLHQRMNIHGFNFHHFFLQKH